MKNRHIALFLHLGLPLLLTSCKLSNLNPENFHPEGPPFNAQNELIKAVNNYLANQQKRYNCLADKKVYEVSDYLTMDGECNSKRPNPDGLTQAQNVRNETIEKALFVIDVNYVEWVNFLSLGRATGNFVADTVQLTTSGVIGALNGPADTLRILGVALNTFQGARSSFDLNYFDKQNTAIIVNQMDSNRSKAYEAILNKKDRAITSYSMTEAIKDMVAYYNAGTLVSAFTALSQQTAIKSQESAQQVEKIQKDLSSDSSVIYSEKRVLETLNELQDSLGDSNKKLIVISKIYRIIAELQIDQNFQLFITEKSPPWLSTPEQGIEFLRKVRVRASSSPQYSQLLNKLDQAIINFGQ